ncbi:M48 family metallopeptidase [Flammeovirga sp. OC4]|uniref:tetratricopeptide repeat protein n=1 Tax=Flammeovirga sp. OC4 TaxID=1382345 RepID=UPI0006936F00|nr:DnaJ domain-containing protein [Flammeovirga sp. OC4]
MFTYYQILEIDEKASEKEIKRAYKRMAKKYHPDVSSHENAEEYFKLIISAYNNLSNPSQRELYDAWLFQERTKTKKRRVSLPKNYQPAYSNASKKKEDREVVRWGMVSVIGFFCLVITFIGVNNYLKDKKVEEQIAYEYSLLQKAQRAAQINDYVTAFTILEAVEYDMQYLYTQHRKLYDSLHSVLKNTSLQLFEEKEYTSLHYLLTDLRDSSNNVLTEQMLWQLALSQFNIQEYNNSAKTFRTLITKNKWNYDAYAAYSEVYSSGLNSPEKAIDILTEGVLVTTEEYASTYGAAYAVILNGEDIPNTHFNLYYLRARLLMQLERHKEVIRDLNWALRLRPNNEKLHFILGNMYSKIGEKDKACEAWVEAERLGHIPSTTMLYKYCVKPNS